MVGPKKLTQLQNINVDAVKDRIFKLLKRTRDRKPDDKAPVAHFSSRYCDENYFEGLVSEKPVQEYDKKLGLKIAWKKKSKAIRNEPLDIFVYAWAAMESALPNFEMLKESLAKKAAAMKKENEEKKKSLLLPPEGEDQANPEVEKVERKKKKIVRRENWVTSYKVN
jgi:phage terminase large subunit GpA-like protein